MTVPGAGFLLNNEMDDFAAKPGAPNQFGLVQGEANAVAPGKRMLSAMTPTIVLDPAGRVRLVTGSPGGSTIITTVAQMISNVVDFGMDLPEATAAPRLHHQHLPDVLRYERGGLRPRDRRRAPRPGPGRSRSAAATRATRSRSSSAPTAPCPASPTRAAAAPRWGCAEVREVVQ